MPLITSSPFEVPSYTPGNDSFTKLLIHSDTTDGDTTFTDSSSLGNTVNQVGGAEHTTDRQKFGATSIELLGDARLHIADNPSFVLATNSFTIDCWVNFNSFQAGGGNTFASQWDGGTSNNKTFIYSYNSNTNFLNLTYSTNGSTNNNLQTSPGSWIATTNTWYHIAISRNGSQLRFFVDGSQIGSTLNIGGNSIHNGTATFIVGGYFISTVFESAAALDGYIDEFRHSVGIARYISNFTPPTLPYGP